MHVVSLSAAGRCLQRRFDEYDLPRCGKTARAPGASWRILLAGPISAAAASCCLAAQWCPDL